MLPIHGEVLGIRKEYADSLYLEETRDPEAD